MHTTQLTHIPNVKFYNMMQRDCVSPCRASLFFDRLVELSAAMLLAFAFAASALSIDMGGRIKSSVKRMLGEVR